MSTDLFEGAGVEGSTEEALKMHIVKTIGLDAFERMRERAGHMVNMMHGASLIEGSMSVDTITVPIGLGNEVRHPLTEVTKEEIQKAVDTSKDGVVIIGVALNVGLLDSLIGVVGRFREGLERMRAAVDDEGLGPERKPFMHVVAVNREMFEKASSEMKIIHKGEMGVIDDGSSKH